MKRGSAFARWMKHHPATPKRVPDAREQVSLKVFCERDAGAWRWGQDQYRCGKCGVIWGIDEPRPPCHSTQTATPRDEPE